MEAPIGFQERIPILIDTQYPLSAKNFKDPENEHDKFLVAVKRNNIVSRYVVGHIWRDISNVIFQFLFLPVSKSSAQETGGEWTVEQEMSWKYRLKWNLLV